MPGINANAKNSVLKYGFKLCPQRRMRFPNEIGLTNKYSASGRFRSLWYLPARMRRNNAVHNDVFPVADIEHRMQVKTENINDSSDILPHDGD